MACSRWEQVYWMLFRCIFFFSSLIKSSFVIFVWVCLCRKIWLLRFLHMYNCGNTIEKLKKLRRRTIWSDQTHSSLNSWTKPWYSLGNWWGHLSLHWRKRANVSGWPLCCICIWTSVMMTLFFPWPNACLVRGYIYIYYGDKFLEKGRERY